MHPISFTCSVESPHSSQKIRETFLDLSRWASFQGWGPLPGIRQASFLLRTEAVQGSRIAVENTDGSRHEEEILEWAETGPHHFRFVIRLNGFTAPVRHMAREFIETWDLTEELPREEPGKALGTRRTRVVRRFELVPNGFASGLLLRWLIAPLLQRATQRHLESTLG